AQRATTQKLLQELSLKYPDDEPLVVALPNGAASWEDLSDDEREYFAELAYRWFHRRDEE
ncbi:MAG: hypothetical protein ACRD4X_08550, partial [Candidatus Acidiferrales bacterium]